MSQFTDTHLYMLALLAKLLAHVTTTPVTAVLSLVGVSGFPMPKYMDTLVIRIPDSPNPDFSM
jgi:hypothetical protein